MVDGALYSELLVKHLLLVSKEFHKEKNSTMAYNSSNHVHILRAEKICSNSFEFFAICLCIALGWQLMFP